MTEEMRQRLKDSDREDLIKAYDLNKSGNAAVDKNGTIVDKRTNPDAVEVPPNNPFLKIHPEEAKQNGSNNPRHKKR